MADKVIHEYRLIETDEGYRIEIKGDKEKIKKWLEGGPRHRRGRWMGRGFGPPGMMFMKGVHGPGDFTMEFEEDDKEQEDSED